MSGKSGDQSEPRPKADDVRSVIETDATTFVIDGFLEDAHLEVSERIETAADVDYSEGRLAKIEKYLAAHFVRFLYDRQEQETGVADIQYSYSGSFGEGLKATSPGQVVIETDIVGILDPDPPEDDEGSEYTIKTPRYSGTAKRGQKRPRGERGTPVNDG